MKKIRNDEATIDNMAPEHKAMVERLQAELADKLALYPDAATAWNLLKFCRARDFHYEKTKAMLNNYFDFRQKAGYERVEKMDMSEFAVIQANYCRGYYGSDYEGRIIVIEKLALSKPAELLGKIPQELIQDYFVQLYERLLYIQFPILSSVHKKRIDRTFLLLDLKDVNITKLFDSKMRAFLEFTSKMGQDYYPELLGQAFIINAPWIFKGIWSVVKVFLDKRTCDKFQIESGSGQANLAKYLDVDKLPTLVGGKATEPLDDLNGPWREEMLSSYERKSFYLRDRSIEYEYYYTPEEKALVEKKGGAQEPRVAEGEALAPQNGDHNSGEKYNLNMDDTISVENASAREVRVFKHELNNNPAK